MQIKVTEEMGRVPVTVFQIEGAIDQDEPLLKRAEQAVESGTRYLLLGLSKVPYINSLGLRGLHAIYNMMRGKDPEESDETVLLGVRQGTYKSHHIKLLNPSQDVMNVLHITGYDMFLDIYKDYKEAVESF